MRKEFEITEGDDKKVKLAIRTPVYEDIEEADKVYCVKIAQLIKESGSKKLLLRSQLETFLRENGVWTKDDEKKVDEINKKIDAKLAQVRTGGKKASEGRQLCIEAMDLRKELMGVMRKRQIFDDATIESMAENEKLDYVIYICSVYASDGRNYWDSFEDMKNDKISEAYRKASVYTTQLVYGVDPEFEKNLPENKWLKKYGFVDADLNYTDRKTGAKVDRNGKPVKELEDEANKRYESLQGDIVEEAPFVDDDTNEPILVSVGEETKE